MKSPGIPEHKERGAALVIVLALVVLLTALIVAYFSRVSSDRQTTKMSAAGSDADQLGRSALDVIVGDLKQEITAGSLPTPAPPGLPLYRPSSAANAIPRRSGVPAGAPDPLPNLIRRSLASDSIAAPGVASRASAINSTTDLSVTGRSVSLSRWNKHYLLPRYTTSTTIDYTPPSPLLSPYNPNPPVPTGFTPPDWVLVTRNGPAVKTAIGTGATALNNSNPANSDFVIGRYAYAIYDEGGLIDANVAGCPTGTTAVQAGRKGYISFADLTQLSTLPQSQIDRIVGWRNSASAQVTPSPAPGSFPVWTFDPASASRYFTSVLSNANGFLTVSNAIWPNIPNPRTDQTFVTRQQLLKFRTDTTFTQNALQYLGTFSRELNRPSWKPAVVTTINPELNTVQVTGPFLRADGTTALVGEPLFKNRFPLPRINELTNPANTLIQRDFGLAWDATNNRWKYVGGTGSTVQSTIETLYQVAGENREPNFFEILKATLLNGSVGLGSGPANTFVAAETRYYITGTTPSNLLSADYQIVQIGANIIDAWDGENIPTFIDFKDPSSSTIYEAAGIENLPYLNKIVFCPRIPNGSGQTADAWLVPSLWNPHQNGSVSTSTGNRVRIALTGSPTYTAGFTVGSTTYTTNAIVTSPTPTIDVSANGFMAPTPPQETGPAAPLTPPTGAVSSVGTPERYYGFHFVFTTPPNNDQVNKDNTDAAYPHFGTTSGNGNIELQVQLPDASYKLYQKWNIAATANPLSAKGVKNNGDWASTNKLSDPEYVALDPRTLRFGVWGSDASGQGSTGNAKKEASYGAEDSVDQDKGKIEFINWSRPQGTQFTVTPATPSDSSSADLSLYATNGTESNHYVDLDNVQRRGDWTTDVNGTGNKKTIMYASAKTTPPGGTYLDRPQIPSAAFQSVAELGQVFRDQPWKTLNFTSATTGATSVSADAGLLDAFTLQDVGITAGKTSLNTRQVAVLTAILSQTMRGIAGTNVISAVNIGTIANRLVALTTANPMMNKSELVTTLMADATVTTIFNTSTTANPWNKEAREGVLRAFCDAGQTRTWNLMIDVIAQSGRYPPTATGLANFLVEGEKRYWLHVAIDRFTGEVIDQQLEAVYE